MAVIPCMNEAPLSHQLPLSTSVPSKSKLRSLFQRRRPNEELPRPSTHSGENPGLQVSATGNVSRRPSLALRSLSETSHSAAKSRLHRSNGRRTENLARVVIDPPPFAQARGQAILHATLETPLSFIEKPRSQQGTSRMTDIELAGVIEDTIQVKRSHKRTESGQSYCSTKAKSFFLVHGPYLLQYNADSEGDALPDKILVLDRDCVAFVCDAVPGYPWALQVSRYSSSTTTPQNQTLKPKWSRLAIRQTEEKRMANTMVLIFDESDELYTWLHAVRKEIEHLGGMDCSPENKDNDDQAWRDDLARAFGCQSNDESHSHGSTAAPKLSLTIGDHAANAATETSGATSTRPQSGTSSKHTSTSLDRLRDSGLSDGNSSTVATSSVGWSTSSTSPTADQFLTDMFNKKHMTDDLRLRTYTTNNETTSPSPKSSILERRKLSVNSLQLTDLDAARARRVLPDVPPTISGSPNDDLLLSARLEDLSVRYRGGSKQVSRQDSLPSEPTSASQKAKYSLFPVRTNTVTKKDFVVSPTALSPSILTSECPSTVPRVTIADSGTKHRKRRNRTVTLELRQHRVSALVVAGTYDLPQRSPAATDDMIMSNFGIVYSRAPPSPLPETTVPGLCDLNFDLDFLRPVHTDGITKSIKPTPERRGSGAKTSPSMYADTTTTIPRAPLGPPPSRPLPKVPKGALASNRSSHTSVGSEHKEARASNHLTPIERVIDNGTDLSRDIRKHRRTLSSSQEEPLAPQPISTTSSPQPRRSQPRSRNKR